EYVATLDAAAILAAMKDAGVDIDALGARDWSPVELRRGWEEYLTWRSARGPHPWPKIARPKPNGAQAGLAAAQEKLTALLTDQRPPAPPSTRWGRFLAWRRVR